MHSSQKGSVGFTRIPKRSMAQKKFRTPALEQAIKAQWGSICNSSTLSLTSLLNLVGGQLYAPAAIPPAKRPSTHCTGNFQYGLCITHFSGKRLNNVLTEITFPWRADLLGCSLYNRQTYSNLISIYETNRRTNGHNFPFQCLTRMIG